MVGGGCGLLLPLGKELSDVRVAINACAQRPSVEDVVRQADARILERANELVRQTAARALERTNAFDSRGSTQIA